MHEQYRAENSRWCRTLPLAGKEQLEAVCSKLWLTAGYEGYKSRNVNVRTERR